MVTPEIYIFESYQLKVIASAYISKLLLQRSLKQNKGISLEIISDLLQFIKKPYNFRNNNMLQRKKDKAVYFGTERISSLAPKIRERLPGQLRNEICLNSFKQKIKSQVTDKCPCQLCQKYARLHLRLLRNLSVSLCQALDLFFLLLTF